MGQIRNAYKVLVRKPEEKRALGKSVLSRRAVLKSVLKQCGVRCGQHFFG
jgi:hypothetical protein